MTSGFGPVRHASSGTHRPCLWSRRAPIMDRIRRTILKTGAAAATMAAARQVFAQQTERGAAKLYEKGPVRIAYQEAGSGFPLLLIAGGGLNSKMAGLATSPFDPI